MEKASLPLTLTSYPRPFNQQLPEPPDPRCILEPQDSLALAPALVCALCCCFGIIYCCLGEGRASGKGRALGRVGEGCQTLFFSKVMPNVLLAPRPLHLLSQEMATFGVFHTASPSFLLFCLPAPSGSHLCLQYGLFLCLLTQNSIPSLSF